MKALMKIITLLFILSVMAGCQAADQEIRADIAGKARDDLNFSGLHYTVANGVVAISGSCPSSQALAKVKQSINDIQVIKAVRYHIRINPVTLDSFTPVKLAVDSILAGYPQVTAGVNAGGITLEGSVPAARHARLIREVQSKQPLRLKDNLQLY